MANANTNLMSVKSAPQTSARQVTRTTQNSQAGSKYNSNQKDFGKELDKAGSKVNQQQDSKSQEVSQTVEQADADMTDAALKTSAQGKSDKTQDAPQQEKISADTAEVVEQISEIIENPDGQTVLTDMAYLFATNTETLLTAKNSDTQGDSNLMTIMPKSDANKSQSMLDLLSGKTWKTDDVKVSMENQNPQQIQNQNQNQNFEVQPQQQNQNPQQILNQNQPQIQNQNQNFEIQPQQQNQPQQVLNQNQPQIQNQNQNFEIQPQQQNQSQQILNQNQPQIQNQNQNFEIQPQQQNQPQQILNQNQNSQVQNQNQTQVQQNQFGSDIQPVVNSVQPQVEVKPLNHQAMTDLLGVNVQVEQNQNSVQVAPIQQLPEYFEQNSQSANQNQPQNFSQNSNNETQQQNSNGGETFNPAVSNANNQTQVQNTAAVQNPEAAQAAREDFNIPGQIVEQARLIRTAQNTEMVINLKPEHLGELTLRISVGQNGAVTASFHSDNAQVRAIIENSLVQLRQELNNQGLKVENVEVYAGLSDGGLMNRQGQQAWQQNQQQGSSNRGRIDLANFEDEVDSVSPTNNNLNATDGVDYKI